MSENEYYLISEVAEMLDISISTVHRYIKDNLLKGYRPANRGPWRVTADSVDKFQQKYMGIK